MNSQHSPQQTKAFAPGDRVEVDSHGFAERGVLTLSTVAGMVTCVRNDAIYTDLALEPFDRETLLPRGADGRPFSRDGSVSMLRHADDPCLPLPSVETIAAMGLPNLKDWEAAILDWNQTESDDVP